MNKKKKNANKKHRKNRERIKKIRLLSVAKAKKPVAKKPVVEQVAEVAVEETKKTAAPLISSGSPILRIGQEAVDCLSISGFSHKALAKSVLKRPGAMALVLTLNCPNSAAKFLTIIISAALDML